RLIFQAHISTILGIQKVEVVSAVNLRCLSDTFVANLRALQSIGSSEQISDCIIVHSILQKLDIASRTAWEESNTADKIPTVKQLIDFLENRCQRLENATSDALPLEVAELTMAAEEENAGNERVWPEELEPIYQEFLKEELKLFEGLQGVSHIAEHHIIMKDDKLLKQRYYPKNPAMQQQHVTNLREVFRRLRLANLKINRKKCSYFPKELVYLGHVVSSEGIRTDPAKVEAIRCLKPPSNCKELRQCLGMASWYRRFV
ncbi:hypothetical protein KR222_007335, partial [Zaprionus bogoriensis]